MKKKAIIAIVSLIVFGQGAWAEEQTPTTSFPRHEETGKNSESNPYIISSIEDLNALAADVNSGTDYSGVYFKLDVEDGLDYTGKTFTPIGYGDNTAGKPFSGIFDGNGKTISGIIVNTPDAWGVGLFGYISKATIKNLTITNSSFTAKGFVGAITGCSDKVDTNLNPAIENCHVTNSVTVNAKDFAAGGIIGVDNDNLTIKDCTCAATVTSTDTESEPGGIIGVAYDDVCMVTIIDSYYLGNQPAIGVNGGESGHAAINITLLNNDIEATVKNSTRIANYDGQIATVTLSGRTLYKDGGWNTICLPFNVVDGKTEDLITFTGTPLEGAIVKKLDIDGWYSEDDKCYTKVGGNYVDADNQVFSGDASTLKQTCIEGDCLYLNFATAESIEAGKPYLIKWASGTNITDPKFEGVTINANASTEVSFTGGGSFVGTYNAKRFIVDDLGQYLLMGGDNTLYYTKAGAGVGACRAYFQVPEGSASIKMFNLNFSDYSAATKITNTNLTNQTYEDGEWWTLSGMKLNGKPSQKGVYLFNGKKVVIQ